MYSTYEEIYKRYLQESQDIASGVVLKTDAHNESGIYGVSLPIAPHLNCDKCYCLEYDEIVIANAMKREGDRVKIMRGDIRLLPFDKDSIDTILDLSTIDHIAPKDTSKVLDGYKNVLKKNGKILLVVWLGDPGDDEVVDGMVSGKEREPSNQYYFKRERFDGLLKERFQIDYQEDIFNLGDNTLVLYRMTNG